MTWPDWRGQTCIVVGTGPSAKSASLSECEGKARCIVIKQSWRLAPWADVLYGIDRGWWLTNNGAREFKGLRVSPSPTACRLFGMREVTLKTVPWLLTKETGVLGCGLKTGGGHSGFQAVNLAVQFGATKIVLAGFDMTLERGAHWHKEGHGVAKPNENRVAEWRKAFDGCADQFKSLGVTVITTGQSALKNYPNVQISMAL